MHTELIRYTSTLRNGDCPRRGLSPSALLRPTDPEFEGYLAADLRPPAHRTPRPAVIVAHAWRGRDDFADSKARQLATLGYVGFAADVYGRNQRGDTDEGAAALMDPLVADRQLLRHRITAALNTISAHPLVDPTRIAAIGFCFGGLTALELARSGAPIRAAVTFHGLLRTPTPADAKNIRCKILALHGHDDPLAPPEDVQSFAQEMTSAEVDWQIHIYGNTAHAFTNPAATDRARGLHYDPTADRRSWQAMRAFFEEVFSC
jgi:dienelactone hydrolase